MWSSRGLPASEQFDGTWVFFLPERSAPNSTLFPYTTLFRSHHARGGGAGARRRGRGGLPRGRGRRAGVPAGRSEEHTSELQSRFDLVCRLLLEEKKEPSREAASHDAVTQGMKDQCEHRALTH